ncbi:hypothetical protein ACP275_11G133400 [Erythranthe tilingii]
MGSSSKFSYQRLKQEISLDDEYEDIREHVVGGLRHPKSRGGGVQIKKRLRVKNQRLKRFLVVKNVWSKIWRRMKESQAHFGHLFAGNYLFMQINTPLLVKKLILPAADNINHSFIINNHGKSFIKDYDFKPCPL